jgi:putative transposase
MTFIDAHRERFGVEPTCRGAGVSVAAHYARKQRPASRRALLDVELRARIRARAANYSVYGPRRV